MKRSMNDKFSLANKVAIITGTTKGLGESLAQGLADAGATVVALDRSDNDHLKKYCSFVGTVFERMKVDLLSAGKKDLERIVDAVVKKYSHVDILVNNAGITRRDEVEEFAENDWAEVLKVNMTAPFYLSQAAAKHFKAQKSGKIINIASMLSYQGGIRVPSYAASKHGLVGLTKSFAIGLAKYGINVNAIAPGFMATEMNIPLQQDKERNALIIGRIPCGRWGRGDDLKGAVIFLASSMSDYVNGAVIPVDGGWLAA